MTSQITAPRLIVQPFVPMYINENTITPHYWSFVRLGERWIPHTNGQQGEKCLHVMTSLYHGYKRSHQTIPAMRNTNIISEDASDIYMEWKQVIPTTFRNRHNRNGHKPKQNGHKPKRPRTEKTTNWKGHKLRASGHKPKRPLTAIVTNQSGHKFFMTQGANSVHNSARNYKRWWPIIWMNNM